jgi:hypothetical protein
MGMGRGAVWASPAVRGALVFAAVGLLFTLNLHASQRASLLRTESSVIERAEVLYVPDNRIVRAVTMGYDQAAADLLWIRAISYFARHFDTDRRYRWLDHFIDQILHFDPRFKRVYHWAGANVLYGSFFTNDDVRRANRYFKLATERFVDDYEAPYRLGLNYYVELRADDPEEKRRLQEEGLGYLELAASRRNAPRELTSLVAAISRRLDRPELSAQYLTDLYLSTADAEQRDSIRARLALVQDEAAIAALQVEADAFAARWQADFGFASPTLFSLMGEPASVRTLDRSWRDLVTGLTDPAHPQPPGAP